LYSSPNIIGLGIFKKRGVDRVLVGKPEGKRPLGRPRHRWEDNIRMNVKGNGMGGRVAGLSDAG
jgi:hypothetical protein